MSHKKDRSRDSLLLCVSNRAKHKPQIMKTANLVCGLISFAIAVAAYFFLEVQQKAFNTKSRLYESGRYECVDKTITELNADSDFTSACVSFLSDFKIQNEVCSDNILSESMCGKCISMSQKVEQYQHRVKETRVCNRKGRNGDTIKEEYDAEDKSENAEKARSNNNCHTTYTDVYEWKSNPSNAGNQAWNFPIGPNGDGEPGIKKIENDANNLNFVEVTDGNTQKVHFNGAGTPQNLNIIRKRTYQILGKTDMPIWNSTFYGDANLEAGRNVNEMCITSSEASNFDADGLTNSEFQALSNFGDAAYYPSCTTSHPTMAVGTYRVSAECLGREASNVRVVGLIERDVNGTLQSGGFTNPLYSNGENDQYVVDDLKPFIWIWDESGASTADAFAKVIMQDKAQFDSLSQVCQIVMLIFGILGVVMLVTGNKKSSSSSSSSSS